MRFIPERVAQEHPMGCAVACVASRCGLTYTKALDTFTVPSHAWTRGFYCEEIVEALAQLGLKYTFARFLPDDHSKYLNIVGSIVFIDPCDRYPSGHFIVRSAEGWMNPWVTFPKMNPVVAEIQSELPGAVGYIIYEI